MNRIYIGQHYDRAKIIKQYAQDQGLVKCVLFGEPLELDGLDVMQVPFNRAIEYSYFYKYIAFTDKQTLFVWNDCLRKKAQRALEYNCIRHSAEQTQHRLVFNTLPIIESREDFMILYTLLEPNTFVRVQFGEIERFNGVELTGWKTPQITVIDSPATDEQRERYQHVKKAAIDAVKRDANIIPRRLLKYAEMIAKATDSKSKLLSRDMTITDTGLPVDTYFINRLKEIKKEADYVVSEIQSRG